MKVKLFPGALAFSLDVALQTSTCARDLCAPGCFVHSLDAFVSDEAVDSDIPVAKNGSSITEQ
jgi:hypothetical protein